MAKIEDFIHTRDAALSCVAAFDEGNDWKTVDRLGSRTDVTSEWRCHMVGRARKYDGLLKILVAEKITGIA